MELSTAQEVLVIILSTALAVFLIFAITATVLIIRILSVLRRVADKTERVIESAEAVGEAIKNVAAPAGILRFARSIFETVSKSKQK